MPKKEKEIGGDDDDDEDFLPKIQPKKNHSLGDRSEKRKDKSVHRS